MTGRTKAKVKPPEEVWPDYSEEYRVSERRVLRPGDQFRATSWPGARFPNVYPGFRARFRFAFTDGDGTTTLAVDEIVKGEKGVFITAARRFIKPGRVGTIKRKAEEVIS